MEKEKEQKKKPVKIRRKKRIFGHDISMEEPPEDQSAGVQKTPRGRKSPSRNVEEEPKPNRRDLAPEMEKCIQKFIESTTDLGVEGLRQLFKTQLAHLCPPGPATAFEANAPKNRYVDVVCLEESRVKLTQDVPPCGDYIHANWVKFDHHDRQFIATQAPMENTIEDFWRMVFQEQCPTIVNLTRLVEDGKAKCAQYWPEGTTGAFQTFGKMFVNIKKIEDEDKFTVYTLEVLPEGCSNSLIVKMIHVQNWPNNGVPMSGRMILRLVRLVALTDKLASGPVVVHCSAGVGRTGTIILIDVIIQQLFKNAQTVDFVEIFTTLRKQRASCIQKDGQFVFLVACCLDYIHARLPDKFVDKFTKFREEYKTSQLATN